MHDARENKFRFWIRCSLKSSADPAAREKILIEKWLVEIYLGYLWVLDLLLPISIGFEEVCTEPLKPERCVWLVACVIHHKLNCGTDLVFFKKPIAAAKVCMSWWICFSRLFTFLAPIKSCVDLFLRFTMTASCGIVPETTVGSIAKSKKLGWIGWVREV